MRIEEINIIFRFCLIVFWLSTVTVFTNAQPQNRPVSELHKEVAGYVKEKSRELFGQGKKIDADKRESLAQEQKALAKKYAAEVAARPDLKGVDIYYLGLLYILAENDEKSLETMKRFLAQYPPDIKGDVIQSARTYIIILSARKKQLAEAEQTFQAWLKGEPFVESQRPVMEEIMAVAYFKNGKYNEAVKYGENAFSLLKKLEAKTLAERRVKMDLYGNLVEVLALSYRKVNKTDEALNVLAESRALAFTIPSAKLYRKVMDIVGGSGFSEKKLMQKVESYKSAEPAPELTVQEWVGREPTTMESLRGKVVLLDFWATWCGPCISTFPRLRGWHEKFSGSGFEIIGVTQYYGNADGKPMTPLQELDFLGEFRKKYKLPYSFAVSKRGEDNAKFDVSAYPTTILLDRHGVVRYVGIGAGAEESANLEDMIKKLLKEEK